MLEMLSDLGLQCLKAEAERAEDDSELKSVTERARQHCGLLRRIARAQIHDIDAKLLLGRFVARSQDEVDATRVQAHGELKRVLSAGNVEKLSRIPERVTGLSRAAVYLLCAENVLSASALDEGTRYEQLVAILGNLKEEGDVAKLMERICVPGDDHGQDSCAPLSLDLRRRIVSEALKTLTGSKLKLEAQDSAPTPGVRRMNKLVALLEAEPDATPLALQKLWAAPDQAPLVFCELARSGVSASALRRVAAALLGSVLTESPQIGEAFHQAIAQQLSEVASKSDTTRSVSELQHTLSSIGRDEQAIWETSVLPQLRRFCGDSGGAGGQAHLQDVRLSLLRSCEVRARFPSGRFPSRPVRSLPGSTPPHGAHAQEYGHPIAGSSALMLYQKTCALIANAWTDATVQLRPERVADETECRALFEELFLSVGDVTARGAAQAQCLFRLSSLVDFLTIWGSSSDQAGALLSECWRDVLSFMIDRRAVAEDLLVQSMPRAQLSEPHARLIVEHVRERVNQEGCEGTPPSKLLFQVGLWCCDRSVREQIEGELILEMMPTKRPEVLALRADDELCALVLARADASRFVRTGLYPHLVGFVMRESARAGAAGRSWVDPFTSSPHHLLTQLVCGHCWLAAAALACEVQGVNRGLRNCVDGGMCALEDALRDASGMLGCVDMEGPPPPEEWETQRRRALAALNAAAPSDV